MNKLGGSPEVFGGYANPAIITYLSKLDQSAADTGVDLSDLEENVAALSDLIVIIQSDVNAAEIDIVDLQQRMIDEEEISIDLTARMVIEEGISIDLTARMDDAENRLDDIEASDSSAAIAALNDRLIVEEGISVDLTARMDDVENRLDDIDVSNAAQDDRLTIEEGISVDLTERMVIEEEISTNLQGRMNAEEATTAVHEAEITVLQDEMMGQQSSMGLAYKRLKLIEYPISDNITGTIPLLVAALILPAGTYTSVFAYIGCSLPSDTAILTLIDSDDSEIFTISGGSGVPSWIMDHTGFTLAAESTLSVWLRASTSTATAIINGLKLEVV